MEINRKTNNYVFSPLIELELTRDNKFIAKSLESHSIYKKCHFIFSVFQNKNEISATKEYF